MHVSKGTDRLERWERATELPLLAASPLFLACYAVVVLANGADRVWIDLVVTLALLIWAAFALDYAVRWALSGQGPRFVTAHWLDTVVLLLPLLRPVRIVNAYAVMRHRRGEPRLSLHGRVMSYASITAALLGFAASLAVYQQERGAPGATILTFGDSVWWACSALTTVGYGDVTPVTPLGRLFAVGLMVCGLALLGAVTGSFSSWLLQIFGREDRTGNADGPALPDKDGPSNEDGPPGS